MHAEFKGESVIVIPETPEEVERFNKLFPVSEYMRNSRYLNIKQFVDPYGNAQVDRPYLLINGHDPIAEANKVVKPRRKTEESTVAS